MKKVARNPELVKILTENELNPEKVYLKSGKIIKWSCFTCYHIYEQKPDTKNRKIQGTLPKRSFGTARCPYCSNSKLCENNNCKDCFNKSCASNEDYIKKWNDEINPRQIFLQSNMIINWKCNICKHIYTQSPNNKIRSDKCLYCAINTTAVFYIHDENKVTFSEQVTLFEYERKCENENESNLYCKSSLKLK